MERSLYWYLFYCCNIEIIGGAADFKLTALGDHAM